MARAISRASIGFSAMTNLLMWFPSFLVC